MTESTALRLPFGWRAFGAASTLWTLASIAVFGEWWLGRPPIALDDWTLMPIAPVAARQTWTWWVYATRQVTLILAAVLGIALPFGCLLGALAAHGGNLFSALLSKLVELTGALPSLVIVGLWRIGSSEPDVMSLVVVLSALLLVETARLVADETRRLGTHAYVDAAFSLGSSRTRAFLVHIFPQLIPSLGVSSALAAASVVGLEAALSFVGLGIEGSRTWGGLLGAVGRGDQPWQAAALLSLLSVAATTVSLFALSSLRPTPPTRIGLTGPLVHLRS